MPGAGSRGRIRGGDQRPAAVNSVFAVGSETAGDIKRLPTSKEQGLGVVNDEI
jgi:hypothetical protein